MTPCTSLTDHVTVPVRFLFSQESKDPGFVVGEDDAELCLLALEVEAEASGCRWPDLKEGILALAR